MRLSSLRRSAFPSLAASLVLCLLPFCAHAGGGGGGKNVNQVRIKNISMPSAGSPPLVVMPTVEVADAGNTPTPVVYPSSATNLALGSVSNVFRIAVNEVTVAQYTAFLNAVAAVTNATNASVIASLYSPTRMGSPTNVSGISRTGAGTSASPFVYAALGNPNHPMAYVTWFNAARFANWMHNGATNGAGTESGAYTLGGQTNNGSGILRNADAKWWIPSEDEWFKAAYFKGGSLGAGYNLFPTKSDSLPRNDNPGDTNQANFRLFSQTYCVTQTNTFDPAQNYLTPVGFFTNSPGPYGTFDQGGNLDEWTDTAVVANFGNARVTRGGSWNSGGLNNNADPRSLSLPKDSLNTVGFRLACASANSTPAGAGLTGNVLLSGNSFTNKSLPPNAVFAFSVRPGSFTVVAQAQTVDPAIPGPQTNGTFATSSNSRVTSLTVQAIGDSVVISPSSEPF